MDRPGSQYAQAIKDSARRILENATTPIPQATLATYIQDELYLDHLAPDTMRRRLKEAISALVQEGVPVVSDARGYRLARGEEDRRAGRRYLVAQLSAMAKRLRAFDAAGADRLAQLAMDLGD